MSSLSTQSLVQQSDCRTSKWKHPPLAEHQLITSTKLFHLNGSENNQLHSKYIPLRHIKAFLPCRSAPKESPGLPPAAYPQDTSQHITDLFYSKLWCTQLHIYFFFSMFVSVAARCFPHEAYLTQALPARTFPSPLQQLASKISNLILSLCKHSDGDESLRM